MRLFDDTDPKTEKVYIDLMSYAPIWKKAKIIDQLYITAFSMADMSVHKQYPRINRAELQYEIAKIFLGDTLSRKIYGNTRAK